MHYYRRIILVGTFTKKMFWGRRKPIILLLLFLGGRRKSVHATIQQASYHEDLSYHRLQVEDIQSIPPAVLAQQPLKKAISPLRDCTAMLEGLITNLKLMRGPLSHIKVYTVQVYTGIDRAQALQERGYIYRLDLSIKPTVTYIPPNYIVSIGRFLEKREAQSYYESIRKMVPHGMIRLVSVPNTRQTIERIMTAHEEAAELLERSEARELQQAPEAAEIKR